MYSLTVLELHMSIVHDCLYSSLIKFNFVNPVALRNNLFASSQPPMLF